MENEIPKNLPSNVLMQLDNEEFQDINIEDGNLPEEIQNTLKQTAMRTIIYQISENYREELENLLGKDNVDENGQPKALLETAIPFELYEFICKNIIGQVPPIEIEIIDESDTSEKTEEDNDLDI